MKKTELPITTAYRTHTIFSEGKIQMYCESGPIFDEKLNHCIFVGVTVNFEHGGENPKLYVETINILRRGCIDIYREKPESEIRSIPEYVITDSELLEKYKANAEKLTDVAFDAIRNTTFEILGPESVKVFENCLKAYNDSKKTEPDTVSEKDLLLKAATVSITQTGHEINAHIEAPVTDPDSKDKIYLNAGIIISDKEDEDMITVLFTSKESFLDAVDKDVNSLIKVISGADHSDKTQDKYQAEFIIMRNILCDVLAEYITKAIFDEL